MDETQIKAKCKTETNVFFEYVRKMQSRRTSSRIPQWFHFLQTQRLLQASMNKAEAVSAASRWCGGGGGLLTPILQKTGLDWYFTLNSVISANSVNTNITGDYILNIK